MIAIIKIMQELSKNYEFALPNKDITKPMSWALYQTWKWCDKIEQPRIGLDEYCASIKLCKDCQRTAECEYEMRVEEKKYAFKEGK